MTNKSKEELEDRYIRVYIATKWENRARAQDIALLLQDVGHTITYKWWTNEQLSQEQAQKDMIGVLSADALVLIVENPDYRYSGTLVEFGMACAFGLPVFVMGHAIDDNLFLKLPNVRRSILPLLEAPHYTSNA